VPSRFLVEIFRAFGIDASIIPNIVDLDRFEFRERSPLRPRLVSTRNFDALYNVTTTIRAFALVQQRWPDASLTLVGGGPQETQLRELVDQLRLRNVTFVGRVRPDQIAQYYADNDIYIQSPNIDNMPTSVIEAFASGLPVVSTEAGGVPAILTHERHGLLAPLGDYERLAAHVLRLLDDPIGARAMAHAAFDTCQACTWPAVREQWLRAYRSAKTLADRSAKASAERAAKVMADRHAYPQGATAFVERRAHPRAASAPAERRA
jgi:L-malate glycosyltransferase